MDVFQGARVWITGGGSGIGKAMALQFAEAGAQVAVSGRREQRLEGVVQTIEDKGGTAYAVPCDVTDEASVAAAVETVAQKLGRIDVVVANAGFAVGGTVEKLSAEDWRRQFDTNVVGLAITAKHSLPHLRKTQGRLGLMGSVAGFVSVPGFSAYHASKFAVRAIGLALSAEVGKSGVSVTLLHPGFVESEIAQVSNEGEFRPERVDRRPKYLMWPTDRAARVMLRALARRKREFVFTQHGKLAAWLGQHMAGPLYALVAWRAPAPKVSSPETDR